jgi:hypothetical protein
MVVGIQWHIKIIHTSKVSKNIWAVFALCDSGELIASVITTQCSVGSSLNSL